MEFFEVVKSRHSVRKFEPREVEQDGIDVLLGTINLAPSAGDLQAYEMVLVTDPVRREALARAAFGQDCLTQAPIAIVFCANAMHSASKYGRRGAELYAVQDATIAAAYCQLAATALGLATVWVGAFDPNAAAEAINAPETMVPVAIIPVGYAAEHPDRTPRRALEDIVHEESF